MWQGWHLLVARLSHPDTDFSFNSPLHTDSSNWESRTEFSCLAVDPHSLLKHKRITGPQPVVSMGAAAVKKPREMIFGHRDS